MPQIEDLQLELDSLICKQSIDKLVELCGYFQVKDPVDGKNRSELVKIIRNDVENTLSTADDNFDVHIFLRDAIPKINGTPPPLERSGGCRLRIGRILSCGSGKTCSIVCSGSI